MPPCAGHTLNYKLKGAKHKLTESGQTFHLRRARERKTGIKEVAAMVAKV